MFVFAIGFFILKKNLKNFNYDPVNYPSSDFLKGLEGKYLEFFLNYKKEKRKKQVEEENKKRDLNKSSQINKNKLESEFENEPNTYFTELINNNIKLISENNVENKIAKKKKIFDLNRFTENIFFDKKEELKETMKKNENNLTSRTHNENDIKNNCKKIIPSTELELNIKKGETSAKSNNNSCGIKSEIEIQNKQIKKIENNVNIKKNKNSQVNIHLKETEKEAFFSALGLSNYLLDNIRLYSILSVESLYGIFYFIKK